MKIKTAEATPIQLDWLVATIEAGPELARVRIVEPVHSRFKPWIITLWDSGNPNGGGVHAEYSTNWEQGGPIIEREKIQLHFDPDEGWWSTNNEPMNLAPATLGPTPLIAAIRCYVASKLDEEVEVPEELCQN